jgi:hypothetical protein
VRFLGGVLGSEAESSSADDSEEEASLYKASNWAFNTSRFLRVEHLFFVIIAFQMKVGKTE